MTTAFIPVRGGSKSIPLKNIKPFCGRPLVYWSLCALQECGKFKDIVVATDSDEIADVVRSFYLKDVTIYRRLPENATDMASSEAVILEYIQHSRLPEYEILVFVQATSPLTSSSDFSKALELFQKKGYDSLLTGVRNKRFFWSDEGVPINYQISRRPRRQDFPGWVMENGAFYISTAGLIKESGCRISGRIGIYEMPDYTAVEIDEEDDWLIAEHLMRKHVLPHIGRREAIKLFLSDVDGTLTDAGMYYDQRGNELKKFNTHDGKGFELLRNAGIKTGIITSETTAIVKHRAKKLNVDYLVQGVTAGGKLEAARNLCAQEGIDLTQVAYIGDDVNCRELLEQVGVAACPANATDALNLVHRPLIRLKRGGGEGAVREFIDMILGYVP